MNEGSYMHRLSVFAIPRESASRPVLAFGIQIPTCIGGSAVPQIKKIFNTEHELSLSDLMSIQEVLLTAFVSR